MTTQKPLKANPFNAQKNTVAKSKQGKAIIRSNAPKHGLFAKRLILQDENLDEYAQLIGGLINSLNPVGTLEQILVEKIAVATWKQLRLIRAESASIELSRRIDIQKNRQGVANALGRHWEEPVLTLLDLAQVDKDTQLRMDCNAVIAEYEAIDDEVLYQSDLIKLKSEAPKIYDYLAEEAAEGEIDLVTYTNEYLSKDDTGIHEWASELIDYSRKELNRIDSKHLMLSIAEQLKSTLTAPIGNELLTRYQTSIDNELYRAIEALRKQQEWRIRCKAA